MPSRARPQTLVTLEFDDAQASQAIAFPLLYERGLRATIFVNSDRLDRPGYLSRRQVHDLHAAGQEIGGHGLGHEDLRKLNRAALARAVVDDRAALRGAGFPCVSFAYPYGWLNDTVKQAVRDAGYASARVIHGLSDTTTLVPPARGGVAGGVLRVADRAVLDLARRAHERPAGHSARRLASLDVLAGRLATVPARARRRVLELASLGELAETVPPRDPFATRTAEHVMRWTTVADLQRIVTAAERRGGWVQIVFHYVGGESKYAVAPPTLAAFLDWLPQRAQQGTEVKTVAEVIGSG